MNTITISFISALTALVASILGPSVSVYVARRQINASVLSVNRQRWIEGLRDLIASLIAQLAAAIGMTESVDQARLRFFGHDPMLLERVERLVLTVAKIRLMLNPTEADHQELLRLMEGAVALLRRPGERETLEGEIQALAEAILVKSQAILKREWIRVKRGR